jgi:hypothetical protein
MTQVRKIFLPLHAMFVRFRQSRNQLQLSLLETRRVAGKVVQGHVASLGSIIVPPAIADRVAFWQKLHERLARLSDRIDAEAQGKILGAVHARAPMVTIEEIRALQLENAETDERFWSQLQDITYSGRAPTLDDSNWRHPLAPDSLFQIAWAIQRRERPRLEDLIAALERDERVIWPEGVLPYVARLIAGKPVPNEPSPWPEEKKFMKHIIWSGE